MPLYKTEAIVLLTYRVGEADKIVVFLTRDQGKLRGMAKGARRPRSKFGGSLEVGTEVELRYFEKESRELVSVDRCDIIRSHFSYSGDPVRACTLAYFTELTDGFAQEKEPGEKLYRLLRVSMESLAEGDPEQVARYFEAWLLRLGGYYPRADACKRCDAPLADRGAHYRAEDHSLRCPSCASGGIVLSPEALRYLKQVWQNPPGAVEKPESSVVFKELSTLHRHMIVRELEKELRSQSVLDDLLRLSRT